MISIPSFRDSDRIVARGFGSHGMGYRLIFARDGSIYIDREWFKLVRNIKRGIKRCMVDWTDCT